MSATTDIVIQMIAAKQYNELATNIRQIISMNQDKLKNLIDQYKAGFMLLVRALNQLDYLTKFGGVPSATEVINGKKRFYWTDPTALSDWVASDCSHYV